MIIKRILWMNFNGVVSVMFDKDNEVLLLQLKQPRG